MEYVEYRINQELTIEYMADDEKWLGTQVTIHRKKETANSEWDQKIIELQSVGETPAKVMIDLALTYNTWLKSHDYNPFSAKDTK